MKNGITKKLRIYELETVNPEIPEVFIRPLRESDMSFFPYWMSDCLHTSLIVGSDPEEYRHHIRIGKTFVLEDDGTPVTMARINREMRTVCGVSLVFTPPYFRGKGYATACVAALSRLILSRGFAKCALYTDLSNPTSNSIYQKIGYRPVCDSLEIKFK
jgi:predicted GNAT family acetyltransferase